MLQLGEAMEKRVSQAIVRLDAWLQSMRAPGGYGGPISHWWESSLLFCGPMADWRYEGILCGYVTLFERSLDKFWLQRAIQAADDLLSTQLADGRFRNSAFQQGPVEGGTPHEAAVDVGLFTLARLLKSREDAYWMKYYRAAELNLLEYQIDKLWSGRGFWDQPTNHALVPNKNATLLDALILYEELSGWDMYQFIPGTIDAILSAQENKGPRCGAFIHRGTGRHRLAIGVYNARTICSLLAAYERDADDRLLEAADSALRFLEKLVTPQGSRFGMYVDGSPIANPKMIAGSGDVLRAMHLGYRYGLIAEARVLEQIELLLSAQLPSGGIPTAFGFRKRGARHDYLGLPEFRDVLPVVGWCDKAFRAITLCTADVRYAPVSLEKTYMPCVWKRKTCSYQEDISTIFLTSNRDGKLLYRFEKSSIYPSSYE